MLIATEELAARGEGCVVIDCRHALGSPEYGPHAYRQAHIPGAFFADIDADLSGEKTGTNGRHPLPTPAAFAAFLERCGVTNESRVVAYDDACGQYAARLWMMSRWLGLPGFAVLQGGWTKWLAEGRPTDDQVPAWRPGQVMIDLDDGLLVSVAEVESSIRDGSRLVVDARAPRRFSGEVVLIDGVGGHIPGAVNRFYEDNFREEGMLKSSPDLQAEFSSLLQGRSPTEVVHQCGSGITGCLNLLAMEKAGLTGSRIYIGSWSEWSADPARPTVTD